MPLLLLSAKSHAPLACSVVNALAAVRCRYQLFAGLCCYQYFTISLFLRPLTHGSKLYIACSAFLQKSELTHAAAPPFRKKSRSARLLGCKRPRCGSLSLPTFCGFMLLSILHHKSFPPPIDTWEQALYRLLRFFAKIGAHSCRCSSFPQKVTLRSPARL